MKTEQIQAAQARLAAIAANRNTVPPSIPFDPDGGPSRELIGWCDKHGASLDTIYLGR
jgi:hypothetical protein